MRMRAAFSCRLRKQDRLANALPFFGLSAAFPGRGRTPVREMHERVPLLVTLRLIRGHPEADFAVDVFGFEGITPGHPGCLFQRVLS
jgi:hypothetical protein